MEYCLWQKTCGNSEPVSIHLEGDEVIVGKSTPNLHNFTIADSHAIFQVTDTSEWWIKGTGRGPGLYVNGQRIETRLKKLAVGDLIGFGSPDLDARNKYFVCFFLQNFKKEIELIDISEENEQKTTFSLTDPGKEINEYSKEHFTDEFQSANIKVGESNFHHLTIDDSESDVGGGGEFQNRYYKCSSVFPESDSKGDDAELLEKGVGQSNNITCVLNKSDDTALVSGESTKFHLGKWEQTVDEFRKFPTVKRKHTDAYNRGLFLTFGCKENNEAGFLKRQKQN